jgi:hypothetical protein
MISGSPDLLCFFGLGLPCGRARLSLFFSLITFSSPNSSRPRYRPRRLGGPGLWCNLLAFQFGGVSGTVVKEKLIWAIYRNAISWLLTMKSADCCSTPLFSLPKCSVLSCLQISLLIWRTSCKFPGAY